MATKFASNAPRKRAMTLADTQNYAGGAAYAQDPKIELASMLVTSMVTDGYYRSADEGLVRLAELLDLVDPLFAAKAAVYARQKDGLRSITHAAAAELTARVKGEPWFVPFIAAVCRRPDDATEILAYYLTKHGKPVPTRLKKGLGKALGKFDAYQAGKYRGEGSALSLVDLVNIVHPKPVEKNAEWLAQLVKGELRSTKTWESKVSAAGPDKAAKAVAWKESVEDSGYLALLRNLRNLVDNGDVDTLNRALERLTDPEHIAKALVFPFQFLIAYKQISDARVKRALNTAIDLSVSNIPEFGNALVVVDHSGSMDSKATGSDHLTRQEIGDLFAAALFKKNLSDVMVFGTDAGYFHGSLNPGDSLLTITEKLSRIPPPGGHGTSFTSIFNVAAQARKKYDTVVIFSDEQAWKGSSYGGYGWSALGQDSVNAYRRKTGSNPDVFSVDLAGLGSTQFTGPKQYQLAGFTDNTLKTMGQMREDPDALIRAIEAIEF